MNEDDNVALFDMDGSLADYTEGMVRDLQQIQSPQEEPVTAENIWAMENQDYVRNRMRLIKARPGFWLDLKPIEMGMDILDACRQMYKFDIHILTKGPKKHSRAWKEKVEWCQRYLGDDVDIHITSDKGLVYGKLLYDDYPEYMLRWLKHRPRGLGIMPVTPYNKDFFHPNVIMYRGIEDLEEVVAALTACKNRKPGEPFKRKP